jgi:cytochrome c553
MKREIPNSRVGGPVTNLPMTALAVAVAAAGTAALGAEGEKGWMQDSEMDEALTLEPDLDNGREVYEVCAACHLTEGWGTEEGTFPQLAGQHRSVLIKQLADIRALNRDNPTMYPFALPESIGDEQALADVTGYIEKLPMNPDWGKGEWGPGTVQYMLGEQLYKKNCVKCHGETGMGDPQKYYPRINGQHYKYMLRQFEWIRDGKRRNANPDMVAQIKGFSDNDMRFVINYVSQQPVPEGDLAPSADWINPDFE